MSSRLVIGKAFCSLTAAKSPEESSLDSETEEVSIANRDSFEHYYGDSGAESPLQCEETYGVQIRNGLSDSQQEDPEAWTMLKNIVALYEGFTAYGRDESIFVRPQPHFYHFEKNYPLPTNNVRERVYQTSHGLDERCQDVAVPIVRITSTRA